MCLVGNQGPWKDAKETTDIVHSFWNIGILGNEESPPTLPI